MVIISRFRGTDAVLNNWHFIDICESNLAKNSSTITNEGLVEAHSLSTQDNLLLHKSFSKQHLWMEEMLI